ncbi:MAG: peptidase S10 [Raineya sp.]|jgi:carboxypeptidase C (cathepsin A)|nr:peptidase S10 [Raineya sp.]
MLIRLLLISVLSTTWVFAQDKDKNKDKEVKETKEAKEPNPKLFDRNIVETKQQTTIAGKNIKYTTQAGYLTLRDETGKPRADIFFMAYLQDGADMNTRPITFTFNGGPGSASVWLHMGCIGPKRVVMNDKGEPLPPPYKYVNNEYSWLDKTDLVFIDPVNTGYSRAAEGEKPAQFLGYVEDIEAVGEFIRLYCSQYKRWASPKYLAGESYGTTRAVGLANFLHNRYNLYVNGLCLISSILNFQTARFDKGNDLPYILHLPTYTATAFYHKKLAPELQQDLSKTLKEAENFALNEYATFLTKGDLATEAETKNIAEKLTRYTGLSQTYLKNCYYRIEIGRFTKELLRNEGKTVGRLDSRLTGVDYDNAGERFEFDPSLDATISGPYATAINHYIRQELKYSNNLPYEVLTSRVQPWNYNNVQNRYLNVGEELRSAMSKNPALKVWVCSGYYDFATPYFATEYTFNHLMLRPEQKKNIKITYYEAGHMMYIHKESLLKMRKDLEGFYE